MLHTKFRDNRPAGSGELKIRPKWYINKNKANLTPIEPKYVLFCNDDIDMDILLAIYLYMTLWYLLSLSLRYLALHYLPCGTVCAYLPVPCNILSIIGYLSLHDFMLSSISLPSLPCITIIYLAVHCAYITAPYAYLAVPCAYLAVFSTTGRRRNSKNHNRGTYTALKRSLA